MPPANRKNPQRAASSESQYSIVEFVRDFPDDETCLQWLWRTRYSEDGVHARCPQCGVERAFKRYETAQQRQSWTCTACGTHLHPTAGTIYHKSSTSLHLWFYAIYLMTSTRCGISAKQLERELGVTYKTAWRMFHLIRTELMTQGDDVLSGEVEMDETWIGGVVRTGRPGRPRIVEDTKTAVFGMVERGGRVVAYPVEDTSRITLDPYIAKHVLPETTIYTDEYTTYLHLDKAGYTHRRIRHKSGVYVDGDVHTNSIENFWSLVKRGIGGVYHAVSAKHLLGYLNEYTWRFNHRQDGQAMFLTLILRSALVPSLH